MPRLQRLRLEPLLAAEFATQKCLLKLQVLKLVFFERKIYIIFNFNVYCSLVSLLEIFLFEFVKIIHLIIFIETQICVVVSLDLSTAIDTNGGQDGIEDENNNLYFGIEQDWGYLFQDESLCI